MDDAVVMATSGQPYRHASPFWPVDVIGGAARGWGGSLKNQHHEHTLIRKHGGGQCFWEEEEGVGVAVERLESVESCCGGG